MKILQETDNIKESKVNADLMKIALENGVSFHQCTVFNIEIEAQFDTTKSNMNPTKFERTILYFTYSLPPSGLKMMNKFRVAQHIL